MVNKKLNQSSSRPAAAPQRKADQAAPRRAAAPTSRAKPAQVAPAKAAPRPTSTRPGTADETSRVAGVQRLYRETVAELRKVQWPDRMTTRNLTLVVIGMSAALAAILGALDAVLTRLIEWLIKF